MIGTSFFMSILPDSATAQIGLRGDVVPVFVVKPQRAAVEVIIAELWRKLCAEQEMRLSLRIFHRAGLAVLRHSDFCDAAGHIAAAKEVVGFLPTAHNAVMEAPAAVAEVHNLVAAKDIPFQLDIAQIYVLADLYEIPHRIFEFNTVVHPNTRREGLGPADIVKIITSCLD